MHKAMAYAVVLLIVLAASVVGLSASALGATTVYQQGTGFTGTCSNPGNAQESDNIRATFDDNENLVASIFGLQSLIGSVATNIAFSVEVEGRVSDNDNTDNFGVDLSWNSGTNWTALTYTNDVNQEGSGLTGSDSTYSAPSSNYSSFGRSWSYGELSDSNFRLRIRANCGNTEQMQVDRVRISVSYDLAGITVSPSSGLETTEAGGSDTFTIVLDSQPTADVTIGLSSSDLSEGTVSPASVTFAGTATSASQTRRPNADGEFRGTWTKEPSTATHFYECVDESLQDDSDYITGTATTSGSARYLFGFPAFDIPSGATITNLTVYAATDQVSSGGNTIAMGIRVNGANYNSTPQEVYSGWEIHSFTWTSNPAGGGWTVDQINGVVSATELQQFGVYSDDLDPDVRVSWVYAVVSYTVPANWNLPQTVTVTGVDDSDDDGDVAYSIVTAAATSGDAAYSGLNAADASVTNIDDDEGNSPPSDIALDNSDVDENQASSTLVGNLSTTDEDVGDSFTYTLAAGAGDTDNASFAIVGDALNTAALFNYEVKDSYSIRVRTTDSDGAWYEEAFTVTVNDVNDDPSDIALDNSDVDENQASSTLVGNLSTTDEDVGDSFTYTLAAGAGDTDNASFAIVGDALNTAALFNYEVKDSYSIRVRTTDSDGAWYEEAFTVTVNDVNDDPSDIALDNSDVDENQASSTLVGNLSTTDEDVGDSFTYTLAAGAGDTDNASFAIVGDALNTAALFNYEVKDSYSIRVRTTDSDGAWYEEAFTVTVNDVNDDPSDIALDNSDVDENQASSTLVGNLSTTDEDVGDSFTYTLAAGAGDTDNASFAIVGDALNTAALFNYEVKDSYSIRVRTTDSDGAWYEEAFTVTVNDVNEAPDAVNDGDPTAIDVAEDSVDFAIDVLANDTDLDGDDLAITAVSDPAHGTAAVDDNGTPSDTTDDLVNYSPDANYNGSDSFTYTISDGEYTDTATVYVNVNALNDAPVITSNGGGASAAAVVKENTTAVTTVTATDVDVPANNLTYSIIGGADAAKFTINASTGVLAFITAPNHESPTDVGADNIYDVIVQVADNGSPVLTDTQALAVYVSNVQEFTLIYRAAEGGSVSGDTVQVVQYGKDGSQVTALPDTGYEFVRWSDGLATASRTDIDVTSSLVVMAEFTALPEPPVHVDRWTDITDAQWVSMYGVTADEVWTVAKGYSDGTFRPTLSITRDQFAKMVVDGFALGTLTPAAPTFTDVSVAHAYYPWIEGAAAAQVVTGYPDDTYRPAWNISRQHANTILGRYLSQQELADSGHIAGELGNYPTLAAWYAAEGAAVLAPFADAAQVNPVHVPFTAYLVYRGVVQGTTQNGGAVSPTSVQSDSGPGCRACPEGRSGIAERHKEPVRGAAPRTAPPSQSLGGFSNWRTTRTAGRAFS